MRTLNPNGSSVFWVCYDIADPKRLRRVARAVAAFGEPLHESAVVCELDAAGLALLQRRIARLIDAERDQVRYVPWCRADRRATLHWGASADPVLASAWIV